jgi:hypothetical protein
MLGGWCVLSGLAHHQLEVTRLVGITLAIYWYGDELPIFQYVSDASIDGIFTLLVLKVLAHLYMVYAQCSKIFFTSNGVPLTYTETLFI